MTGYALFDNLSVNDPDGLAAYRSQVKPVVERYGGRYRVVGGECQTLEGAHRLTFPVLIEFPDLASAQAWYHSEEYRPLRELRHRSATVNAILMATDEPDSPRDHDVDNR
jgi:uncharacterized protein (DUF1330 family)